MRSTYLNLWPLSKNNTGGWRGFKAMSLAHECPALRWSKIAKDLSSRSGVGPSLPLSSCVPGLMCLLSTHIVSLINGTGDNTYLMGLFWEVTELKYAKHFESCRHIHIQQMCPIIIFSLLYYSLSDHVGWPKSVIPKYKKIIIIINFSYPKDSI